MTCIAEGMTFRTMKGPWPDPGSDLKTELPIASKVQPALVDSCASAEPDLEKLKAKLSELAHLLTWGISDGWGSLGDNVKRRLEHWLRESRHQLPVRACRDEAGQA